MMNHIVPDFDMDEDSSMPSSSGFFQQKKQTLAEDELVELLWRNGQVVMQNQNQRPHKKSPTPQQPPPSCPIGDAVLPPPPEKSGAAATEIGPSTTAATQLFMQEDEMASWLHYPLDDSFDRDFCAELLYSSQLGTSQVAADRHMESKPVASSPRPPMPPTARRSGNDDPLPNPKFLNFGHFSLRESREESRPSASDKIALESAVVDSSLTPAVGPSSSRVRVSAAEKTTTGSGVGNSGSVSTCDGASERELVTVETTMTSSSGGSGASPDTFAKPTAGGEDRKRKARDTDDLEGLSEEAGYESVEEKKAIPRTMSTRRTRAAEVHNLSERRRRDRINEKMKALQELIPRCNKTDKASMLDEAIEYLKSLQLQVQMMSMGCSMGPMMFSGVPQYLPPMGMGMGMGMNVGMGMGMGMGMDMNRAMLPFPPVLPTTLPSSAATHMCPRLPIPPFHIPHVPPSDLSKTQPTSHVDPACNLAGVQGPSPAQMLNPADPYQNYLYLHHMQVPPQNHGATQPAPSTPKEAETPESHKSG